MGQSVQYGVESGECRVDEWQVRARADSEVLEVDMGRDSGGRGVKIRRALTNVSNQLGFGFRIPQLVGSRLSSLQASLPRIIHAPHLAWN